MPLVRFRRILLSSPLLDFLHKSSSALVTPSVEVNELVLLQDIYSLQVNTIDWHLDFVVGMTLICHERGIVARR